jgi:4-carboxymuconolactone decarboxylase
VPRLPEITSAEGLPPEAQAAFDSIVATRRRVGGPFAQLMHAPEVAQRLAHLGAYLRFESVLPEDHRELAIITAAREADCAYEWAAHVRLAREVGVREDAIGIIAGAGALDGLTEEEALIANYGHQLLSGHALEDATFEAALARYGEQGVMELTTLFGYYTMVASVLNAMDVRPPADADQLPARQ